MVRHWAAALGGVYALFAASSAAAQVDIQPVKCRFGKDGYFASEAEFRAYRLHQDVEEYKYFDGRFDGKCDGVLDAREKKAYRDWINYKTEGANAEYRRYVADGQRPPAGPAPKASPKPTGWSRQFVLRDSFEDISTFIGPKDPKLASGATFGFSRDDVLSNTSWAAKGVLAYPVSFLALAPDKPRPLDKPYIMGFAFTPTIGFQKNSNSNATVAKKNDVDVLSLGAGAEIAVQNLTNATTTHFFRFRSAEVLNFSGEARSWNLVGEYQPVTVTSGSFDLGSPNRVPGLDATWQLDLTARAHFARKQGDLDDPLFDQRNDVFRLGPVVALSVLPFQGDIYDPVLQRINFTAGYSWLKGLNNGQTYNHFITSLGYAFDGDGKIGMKISYETGKIEETGQDVRTTKVGLTAKY